jgi:hypothetical protein
VLPATADFWAREVESAVKFRDEHLEAFEEIVKRQHGKFFRKDRKDGPDSPENDVHTYKAFMLPELCFGTPSARIAAKRPSIHEEVADALDAAVESWIAESDFGAEVQFTVDGAISGYGILHISVESPRGGGYSADALRPYACDIPARKFLIDKDCEKHKYARFYGHQYERDLDQVLANPRLTPEAIEKLTEMAGEGEATTKENPLAFTDGDGGSSPEKKKLKLVDLYIVETAQVATLAMMDGTPQPFWVNQPRPFWGPKNGPYVIYGMYHIDGDPLPMGPIQPWLAQSQEKNAHLAAAAVDASTAKKLWLTDASQPDVKKAITDGNNGDVIPIKGLNKDSVVEIETGTMSNNRLEYIATIQERMDRVSGQSDAQRGRAAKTTATEADIVESNADIKTEWMRSKVVIATTIAIKNVLWYFIHDPNVVQKVSRQDPATGEMIEGIFIGGNAEGEDPVDVDDFTITLDPQSMQRTDDTVLQQRWLQLIQLCPQIAQLQQMGFNVRWLVDQYGNTINQRNLSKSLFAPGAIGMMPGLYPPAMGGALPGAQGAGGAIPPVNANLGGPPNPNMGNQLAMGGGGFPQSPPNPQMRVA